MTAVADALVVRARRLWALPEIGSHRSAEGMAEGQLQALAAAIDLLDPQPTARTTVVCFACMVAADPRLVADVCYRANRGPCERCPAAAEFVARLESTPPAPIARAA